MVFIEVEKNPNCEEYPQMVYAELEPAKEVRRVRIERNGQVIDCWITGVEEGGAFSAAKSQEVTDSGAGSSYLISGGLWGLRLQKENPESNPWDLNNSQQWGEPYLLLDQSGF